MESDDIWWLGGGMAGDKRDPGTAGTWSSGVFD